MVILANCCRFAEEVQNEQEEREVQASSSYAGQEAVSRSRRSASTVPHCGIFLLINRCVWTVVLLCIDSSLSQTTLPVH